MICVNSNVTFFRPIYLIALSYVVLQTLGPGPVDQISSANVHFGSPIFSFIYCVFVMTTLMSFEEF